MGSNDINTIKEVLINFISLLSAYDDFASICFDNKLLPSMVVMVDVTFPIMQEQLNQFMRQRSFKNDQQKKEMFRANDDTHPSMVISTRLCLSITQSVIVM